MKIPVSPLPFAVAAALLAAAVAAPWRSAPPADPARAELLAWMPTVPDLCDHYARVERELAAADPSPWSPEQRAARARAIEILHAYRERAHFGRSSTRRGFSFVDAEGRNCAVAQILHETGRDDIVERVACAKNDALVAELAADPELRSWLDETGLTLAEAARIQGPHGGGGSIDLGRVSSGPAQPPPAWGGPGDTVAGRPAGSGGPTTTGGSSTDGPTPPAGSSSPLPTSPAAPSTLGSATSHEVGPEAWWTWWELHRLDYLEPNLIKHWVATVTGWSQDGGPHKELERLRRELQPFVERTLVTGDPRERAAAAVVLGRIGADAAVGPLVARFGDASVFVRERSILALGATGSPRAAEVLLRLARTGRLEERGERVCADARTLAILALGIGRRNGFDEAVDAEVARIASQSIERADREQVRTALACYQILSPSPALAAFTLGLAGDERASDWSRCRATEALRLSGDGDALVPLLRNLTGSRLELRRSAALAVGELDDPLAIQPLLTAAETEKEPLARAFMLVSIGRHGGPAAKAFLLDYLKTVKKSHRPWTALGLGILAAQGGDEEARAALRHGFAAERNREWQGAWYLAMGIARDPRAVPILAAGLSEGSMPEVRSAAAFGLAMIGTAECRELLLARLPVDPCDFTRGQIAQSLGFLGDPRDAEVLLDVLRDLPGPDYAATVALGIGVHGSRAALEGLVAIARDEATDPPTRAAALEALQLLAGRGPSLTLNDLLRQSNFAVFPPPLARHRDLPL